MLKSRFADLNVEVSNVDPRSRTRTTEMKVLVLGYPRTATSSIQKALEDLGFGPCYHMRTCINERPKDCGLWTELFRAKYDDGRMIDKVDFDHLLGDCASACDVPACAFGPELMASYPDAKVILTNRSEDSWFKSCASTLQQSRSYWLHDVLARIDWVTALVHTMRKEMWKCLFKDNFEANGKAAMRAHYEEIRRVAKAQGREVLEFSASDGWQPLCKFLEVDIPDCPYPRLNDGDGWLIKMRHRAWRRLYSVITSALPSIVASLVLVGAVVYGFPKIRGQ